MKVIPKRAAALCTAALLLAPLSAQALTNVTPWAETELAAAEKAGLIPAFFEELDAAAPITRAEFCAVALAAYGAVTDTEVYIANVPVFTDCYDPNVSTAYLLGLASGRANGTFDPDATITRQELCVMLGNVARAAGLETDIPTSEALAAFPDSANTAAWAMQDVFTMVEGAVMSGVTVGSETLLEPTGTASRQQAVILANRFVSAYAKPSAPPETEDYIPVFEENPRDVFDSMLEFPKSETEKHDLVFGEDGTYFETEEEARDGITEVEVPVWRLKKDGSKVSGKSYIEVNTHLAPIVQQIFQEIYEGDEKFPIKNVGGWAWRNSPTSEHRWGTAIDINWEENYEAKIGEDGELIPLTGTHWDPDEDPYSIPADGDVVNAFKKYGFSWGGDAWTSKRDYMHFSYFGR